MNPKTLLSNLFKIKYFLILFVFVFLVFSIKKTFALGPPIMAPGLGTTSVTSITTSSVTLTGTVASSPTACPASAGFHYGLTTGYGTTVTTTAPNCPGPFTPVNLTGLSCSTTYYFQAYGTNSAGSSYNTGSFTTTACPTAPTVTTSPALYISTSTAQLNGIVVSAGVGTTVISHGYLFGTTTSYGTTYPGTSYSISVGFPHSSGGYSGSSGWLTCGTTYHYKYYATSDNGLTGYGSDASFITDEMSPCAHNWSAISSSATGTILTAAVSGGYIYRSTDSGTTWTRLNNSGAKNWAGVTSSDNGVYIAATEVGGNIYRSTDSGTTWTTANTSGVTGFGMIKSSTSGSIMITDSGSHILVSSDYGATWGYVGSSSDWEGVDISSNGTRMIASGHGHVPYISNNSGTTWTALSSLSASGNLGPVTVSDDGNNITVADNAYGGIYASINGGTSWAFSDAPGTVAWTFLTSSTSGQYLAASVNGYLYTSSNYGLNWSSLTTLGSKNWSSVAMTSSGNKIAAAVNGEYIHTLTFSVPTVSTGSATSITTTSATLSGNISNTGGMNASSVSFNYGTSTSYGTTTTTTGSFGTGTTTKVITGLICNTTYHFNFYATNIAGINSPSASDASFTTSGCQTPVVNTATSTSIATSSVVLNGIILSNNAATSTTRGFNYGFNTGYGTTASTTGSFATGTFSQTISGLQCGSLYHYNAFAINSYGWNSPSASDFTFRTGVDPFTCAVDWRSITSSADGSHIAATNNGPYMFGTLTTTNYGMNWTRTIMDSGSAITSSSDGTRIIEGPAGGLVHYSTDSGATWTTSTSASLNWYRMDSTSDGMKVVGAQFMSDYVYTSSDGGATWTQQTGSGLKYWSGFAYSASGTKLFATADPGSGTAIYKSTNNGVSWATSTVSGSHNFLYGLTVSSDGNTVYAPDYGGYIYKSTNSGSTWTSLTGSGTHNWRAITSSSDGSKVFAAENGGYIYISLDGGTTWTADTTLGVKGWNSLASSADGSQVVAGVSSSGYLYIFHPSTSSVSTLTPTYVGTSTATFNGIITDIGGANSTSTGFNYGLDTSYGTTISTSGSFATGTFSQTVTGLNCGTTYHYNAFSHNLYGYNSPNASDTSFTTNDGNVVFGSSSSCNHNWTDITSSADGNYLAAVNSPTTAFPSDGYVYTSSDGGSTWTKQIGSGVHYWTGITSSSDGSHLAAIETHNSSPGIQGYVYTSSDYGVTWTQRTGAGLNYWSSISSSSDGSHLVLVGAYTYIYVSTDYGASWATSNSGYNGASTAISGDGFYIATVDNNGSLPIELSSNGGYGWYGGDSARFWQSVSMSSDGSKIVAGTHNSGSDLYYSSDYGVSFSAISPPGSGWVAGVVGYISPDGTKIFSIVPGSTTFYVSSDEGTSWISIDDIYTKSGVASANVYITSSSNSSIAAVAVQGGLIYIEHTSSVVTESATSVGTSTVTMNGTITDTGGSSSTQVGFNYGLTTSYGSTTSVTGSFATGTFSQSITGLACDTFYNYNAYSINAFGINSPAASNTSFLTDGNPLTCSHIWNAVASVSNGQKLFAAWANTNPDNSSSDYYSNGYIYESINGGVTWTRKTTSLGIQPWYTIGSSVNGNNIIATTWGGYIYVSSDEGNTWVQKTTVGHGLNATAVSPDGTKMITVGSDGMQRIVYFSSDSGSTWATSTLPGTCSNANDCALVSVTLSNSGTKAAIMADSSSFYTGNYSGSVWSWTQRTGPISSPWNGGSMGSRQQMIYSGDGTRLVAISSPGGAYIVSSSNDGVTWNTITVPTHTWSALSVSYDGNRIAAIDTNTGYVNIGDYNSGSWVWTPLVISTMQQAHVVAISNDKSKLIFAESSRTLGYPSYFYGGYVHIVNLPVLNLSINSIPANGTTTIVSLPSSGGDLSIGWAAQNLSPSSSCIASGDWSGNKSSSGGSETITVPANSSTSTIIKTYTLGGCSSSSGIPVSTTTATISVAPTNSTYVSLLANGQTTATTSRLIVIPHDSITLSWSVQNVNANSCVGTSSGSYTGWASTTKLPSSAVDSNAVAFSEVVGTDGSITTPRTYTVTCNNSIGGGTTSSTAYIGINPNPFVHLSANGIQGSSVIPTLALPAASSTVSLSWITANVTSCTAGGDWSGSKSATSGTSQSITVPANTTTATTTFMYSITCSSSTSTSNPSVVTIQRAPSTTPLVRLYANSALATSTNSSTLPTTVVGSSGGQLNLVWVAANVSTCTAGGGTTGDGWSGSKNPNGGNFSINLSSNTTTSVITKTYSIGCIGAATTTAYVNILPTTSSAIIFTSDGNPSSSTSTADSVLSGGGAGLSWTVQNVLGNSCYGTSYDYGSIDGSFSSSLGGSFSGWNGTSTTKAPVVNVGTTSRTYSENVSSITTDRSYTLHCLTSSSVATTSTVFVGINYIPTPYPPVWPPDSFNPYLVFSVDGTQTNSSHSSSSPDVTLSSEGGSVTLTWNNANLSSCTAIGDWSGTSISSSDGLHSQTISLAANTGTSTINKAYSISCVGDNSSIVTAPTAYINIVGTGTPLLSLYVDSQPTSSLSPAPIIAGTSHSISWSVQNVNANSCVGTSSGSYTGWASTTKLPSVAVGATSTTFSDTIDIPSSTSSSSRTYTMTCTPSTGGSLTDTVYLYVIGLEDILTDCNGHGCVPPPHSLFSGNGIIRLPWLEI